MTLKPKKSKKHVDMLRWMEDNNLFSLMNMSGLFCILGGATASVTGESKETDLSCPLGVRTYLKHIK